jgi:hypothetical protein
MERLKKAIKDAKKNEAVRYSSSNAKNYFSVIDDEKIVIRDVMAWLQEAANTGGAPLAKDIRDTVVKELKKFKIVELP